MHWTEDTVADAFLYFQESWLRAVLTLAGATFHDRFFIGDHGNKAYTVPPNTYRGNCDLKAIADHLAYAQKGEKVCNEKATSLAFDVLVIATGSGNQGLWLAPAGSVKKIAPTPASVGFYSVAVQTTPLGNDGDSADVRCPCIKCKDDTGLLTFHTTLEAAPYGSLAHNSPQNLGWFMRYPLCVRPGQPITESWCVRRQRPYARRNSD